MDAGKTAASGRPLHEEKNKMFTTKTAVFCAAVAAGLLGLGPVAHATTISNGFESYDYSLTRVTGYTSAQRTTNVAHSGTHSIELGITNDSYFASVSWGVTPGQVQLGGAIGTYWAYLPDTSGNTEWVPFVTYWVDTDRSGGRSGLGSGKDSLVIAFYGAIYKASHTNPNEWMQWGIFDNTNVHVVGNRTGLGNMFTTASQPSGVGDDTFGNLGNMALGSGGTWGGLDILTMSAEANANATALNNYHVYVDDMQLSNVSVPAPSVYMIFLLSLGGLLLLGWRRQHNNVA